MNRTNFKKISENPCRLCRYYKIGYFKDISGYDEFIRK